MKLLKYKILVLFALFLLSGVYGQNGESLFKSKCNTCHTVEKNSTGPKLQGVKQKWVDAGEGDLLHEWVKNSSALITSGKSKMAKDAEGFSPTVMPVQPVSDEDIDAIFDYVDNYVAPAPPGKEMTPSGENIKIVPNYSKNLTIFGFLLALTLILLITIHILSKTINAYVSSDIYRKKLIEKDKEEKQGGTALLTIAAVMTFLLYSNTSLALSFQPNGDVNTPWILIEKTDINILLAINIILAGVVLYLRNMLNQFYRGVQPKEALVEKKETSTAKKWNKILTDAVPLEKEEEITMEHEYDGIKELDNNLPPWWVMLFFATIVFSVVYVFHYHILKTGDLQIAEYTKEVSQADKEVKEYLAKMAMNVDETNATVMTDPADLAAGKSIFTANCVTCHKANGEGDIGPNLTDDYWIYSPDIKDLFKTIKSGTANGMPEHASKLNPIQIQQVASYVWSLPYVKGKEPEGKKIDKTTLEPIE